MFYWWKMENLRTKWIYCVGGMNSYLYNLLQNLLSIQNIPLIIKKFIKFYHSLTICYRSFKMFQNEVGTVHWMQWYLDWKFFLKFLNIPNILTCQQAFLLVATHLIENLFMMKRLSLMVCQSAWKFVVFMAISQYLIIYFWSSILKKLIVNFRNKNLIVIFKLCCLKMHRVLGINKGKNNCNFEKERCVIFFQFRRGHCWRRFSKMFNCFSIQRICNISSFQTYLILHRVTCIMYI